MFFTCCKCTRNEKQTEDWTASSKKQISISNTPPTHQAAAQEMNNNLAEKMENTIEMKRMRTLSSSSFSSFKSFYSTKSTNDGDYYSVYSESSLQERQ